MHQQNRTKRQNKDGFLIFELFVTVTLFIIFSSCLLFTASWFSKYIATTELKALQSFFFYMQQKAVALEKNIHVVCDLKKNQCHEIDKGSSNELFRLHKEMVFQIRPGILGSPTSQRQEIEKPITFINNTIVFYKTGTISSGTIYLLNTQNKIQYALSNAVSQIPYLRLYEYKNNKWELLD